MISLRELFKRQILRELRIHARQMRVILNTGLFFLMIMVFFPLSLPANSDILRSIAPGLVWVALVFSFFLSSERLFQQDYGDGVIEQWMVSCYPSSIYVVSKILVHWVLNMLPMLAVCPVIALFFGLNAYELGVLTLSLLCGTPFIIFFCALSAVFGVGMKQQGVLIALILLPLVTPVMIFGSGTVLNAMQGLPVKADLALLLACSILAITCLPLAISGILRVSLVD